MIVLSDAKPMTFKLQTQVDDAVAPLNVSAWALLKNRIVKKGIRMPSKRDERGIAQICGETSFSVGAVSPPRLDRAGMSTRASSGWKAEVPF